MAIAEASHVENRQIPVINMQGEFFISCWKPMISDQEKSFYDVVEVKLERETTDLFTSSVCLFDLDPLAFL